MLKDYQPAPDLLAGRIILITGAGDGLGRAAALACAAHGATVILHGRTKSRLEQVYDEIEAAGHPEAIIHPLNLATATADDYLILADALRQQFGRLDGLLHNAAMLGAITPLEQYDPELWFKVWQVNLHAPFMLTRACLPLLRNADHASVVFTTDAENHKSGAYWGAYGLSKTALDGMLKMLAGELRNTTEIRVNGIYPGAVRSGIRISAFPGELPDRLPLPETVMQGYLYLLGPDSVGTHGVTLAAPDWIIPA